MTTTPASLVAEINDIYAPLLSGLTFDLNLPLELSSIDLITTPPTFTPVAVGNIPSLTLADLTAGDNTLTGAGAFDVIMKAINKHLDAQFKTGNIAQSERAKMYVAALELALSQGASYVVAANTAAWNGETNKRQAELLEIQKATTAQEHAKAILDTITAKLGMAKLQIEANTALGGLVATKVKIGDVFHDIVNKEAQQELLNEQIDAARAQTKETLRNGGGAVAGQIAIDKNLKNKQITLVDEQIDAARAQTKNTITGGVTPVGGILGSQKALYDQQKTSYIHDSMNKAAKMLSDAWTTQKTVDDGWTPPTAFLNAYLDPAIKEYIQNVGLASA